MKLKCGRPLREWLRHPLGTYLAYRNCAHARIGITTQAGLMDVKKYEDDQKIFFDMYRRRRKKATRGRL